MSKMWEPKFEDWSEDKVSLSSCELSTHSTSRNEYGVVMQVEETEEPHPDNAAIFWIDPQHLYLRYDWDQWYSVSTEDRDNCAHICKRNTATLLICTMSSIKYHAVRVYHIDKLPEELFGKEEDKSSDGAELTDAAFLASTILFAGGNNIAHFEFEPYSADFYEFNGHFIAASYFDKKGDWMADEDSEGGDTPVWFGAKEITKSPLAIAAKIRAAIDPIIGTRTPFHSLILINMKCNIMNEIQHSTCWKDTDIRLVRKEKLADSMLDTVEETLKGFTGESRPEMAEHEPMLLEALNAAFK